MTNQLHLIGAPAWGPHGADLLAGHRTEGWRFELLDHRNRVIRPLDGISGFSGEQNLYSTIRGGGSCVYQGGEPIDWMRHRIRAHYRVSNRGRELEWPIGTYIVESPSRVYTDATRQAEELDLYDVTARLEKQTSTAGEWVAHKGSTIVETLRYLLGRQGIAHAIEDSDDTFSSDMVWPAGTTYLRMVNDMLDAAGFFAIWADPTGVLRSGPYRPPASRGVAFDFRDDADGHPYREAFTHNLDTYSVPNQQVCIASSDDPDAEPMVATATDGDSPYGVRARGMTITAVETDVPAATMAALQARADRRLDEAQRPASTIEYEHLLLPMVINDVVALTRARHGVEVLAVVEKMSFSQEPGALCKTTIREVRA